MSAPDPALVEAVARRVVELLRDAGLVAAPAPRYLTTEEVARRLSVTPRWVREHRALLDGERLGRNSRGPLRFPAAAVDAAVSGRSAGGGSQPPDPRPRSGPVTRRRSRAGRAATRTLPVRSTDPADLPERTPRRRSAG